MPSPLLLLIACQGVALQHTPGVSTEPQSTTTAPTLGGGTDDETPTGGTTTESATTAGDAIPTIDGACRDDVLVHVTGSTDGDTFYVDGPDGSETIRIIGVDTPEISHGSAAADCYGDDVAAYTAERLVDRDVWLAFDGDCTDAYGRTLAYVYLVGDDGSVERYEDTLLTLGYARALAIWPNTAYEDELAALLLEAQEAGAGLWGACPTAAGIELGHFAGDVSLTKMVATSGPVAEGYGFYVQDPGGGAWGGLWVYTGTEVAAVAEGDLLTLAGTIGEYADTTQITASSWEVVDTDWVDSVWLDDTPADWEPYENVLVTLPDVEITGTSSEGFLTDVGLVVDDRFEAVAPEGVVTIEGIVHGDGETWFVSPRSEDDLN